MPAERILTARWYSASALDYYFRKTLHPWRDLRQHQRHVVAVPFRRSSGLCRGYETQSAISLNNTGICCWKTSTIRKLTPRDGVLSQYVKEDSSESVVYIFRDKSEIAETTVHLRGLDAKAKYRVTSLNDRPGRDRDMTGETLMNGISVHLPEKWLASGDGAIKEFSDQQLYGSDILLLRRLP